MTVHKRLSDLQISRPTPSGPTASSCRAGFTLIELLIVIAIILVLSGLMMSTLPMIKLKTQKTQARHNISQIETAFVAYFGEYKTWPTGLVGYDNTGSEASSTGIQVEEGVVRMLRGENVNDMNPRMIPFFDTAAENLNEDNHFIDPWDNPYKFMLDYNQDDNLRINFTDGDWSTNFPRVAIAVWSRGQDGSDKASDGGNKDDVTSW